MSLMRIPRWCCGKEPPASAGDTRDTSLIPGSGSSPGERNGNPLQHSCLENPTDGGTWQTTVHSIAKSLTQLSIQVLFLNENSQSQSGPHVGPVLDYLLPYAQKRTLSPS